MFRCSSCAAGHPRSTANARPAAAPQPPADARPRSCGLLVLLHAPTPLVADHCLGPRAILGVEVLVGCDLPIALFVAALILARAGPYRHTAHSTHHPAGPGLACA